MENKGKVLLGMSGGVDSSVAAILLKKQGYQVIGATMKLWENEGTEGSEEQCCSLSASSDAKRVCDILEIPHYTLNFKEEFKNCVVNNFIETYKNVETPNPCIECNKHLKFNYFYKKALELGCEYIATGHYAKTEFSEKYNTYVLKKSVSEKKDQSYVLYNMPKEIISKVLFPLGDYREKNQIRQIAEDAGLRVAHKPDSQEICFIPDNDYGKFLLKYLDKPKTGNIVDKQGNILGKHNGLIFYTVGQRKGLGISSKIPLYVIKLDKEKNQVIVGEEKDIYSKELFADSLNLLLPVNNTTKIKAKIRYSAKEAEATLNIDENNIAKVTFEEPQRAITKGQSVVFYLDDVLLGGGKII